MYTQQHSFACEQITLKNLKMFLAILVFSGYNRLPSNKLRSFPL